MTDAARPAFLITVDTEGDDIWSGPSVVTTRNSAFIPRFQALCERFGFKPTYLTNYEMTQDRGFVSFARDVEARGAGEVGMHLHAWNSPPAHRLTADDDKAMPYLIDYPTAALRAKVADMTGRLQDTFGRSPTSHRAGRWAMDARYVEALIEHGYTVDCSVTPHVYWDKSSALSPGGEMDYRRYPAAAYFVDPADLSKAGDSPLLELPMTIASTGVLPRGAVPDFAYRSPALRRLANRLVPVQWLRPMPGNLSGMIRLIDRCVGERRPYVEMMLHSSELMPAGSPYFRDAPAIERLYADLEALFVRIALDFDGSTLRDYRAGYAA